MKTLFQEEIVRVIEAWREEMVTLGGKYRSETLRLLFFDLNAGLNINKTSSYIPRYSISND